VWYSQASTRCSLSPIQVRENLSAFCISLTWYIITGNPLVPVIAYQYVNDRESHDRKAAEWTCRFAMSS